MSIIPCTILSIVLKSAVMLLPGAALGAGMLQPFEPASLQQIVQQHKGKPFVLFIWSLDCTYCQTSLDVMAEVRRSNKDLKIVTLSTDSAADPQVVPLMEKRLAELKMQDNAWAFGSASPDKLKYAIDPKWFGEKPRSYWFNSRGERIAYSGMLTPEKIKALQQQAGR